MSDGGSYREADPEPLAPSGDAGEGVLVISGSGVLAGELRSAAQAAGYEVRGPHQPHGGVLPSLIIECDRLPAGSETGPGEAADRGAGRMILCAEGSLGALDPAGSAVGFHVLPPFGEAGLVELTRAESSSPLAGERAERLLGALGKHVAWVGDAPGLVLGRIVCQLVNECAFALGEGVGEAADIDTGMLLGLSHPRGPLRWADADRPGPRAGCPRRALRRVPRGALPSGAGAAPAGGGRAHGAHGRRRVLRLPPLMAASELYLGNLDSPFGPMAGAIGRGGLLRLAYPEQDLDRLGEELGLALSAPILEDGGRLDALRAELDDYFAGRLRRFRTRVDCSLVGPFARGS